MPGFFLFKTMQENSIKKVAIQGIAASFHAEAAQRYFETDFETVECTSFSHTCKTLKKGKADFATLAIENSIAGTILSNYQLIRDLQLSIVGEVYVPIHLHMLANKGVKFEDVKYVQSHPMAIRQVQSFFEEYPHIELLEKNDTAACAKQVAESKSTDTVAIANSMAADVYGLNILEKRLEKHRKNYTRFWVLGNAVESNENANKATLTFRLKHVVGALAKVLQLFADRNINLSKIQSLPLIEEPDNYQFYLDVEFKKREHFESALLQMLRLTSDFSLLGEYKKNDTRKTFLNEL